MERVKKNTYKKIKLYNKLYISTKNANKKDGE